MKDKVRLFLTGFGMGAADIVPGVSGGTIAFIFGIYEELVYSIKKVSGETLKFVLKGKFSEAFKSIPFGFLIPLGLGLLSAVALLSNLLSNLLETQPVFVWSFFFGLVLASIWLVRKRVVTWDMRDYLAMALTTVAAYWLVGAVPVATPETPIAYFLAGAIAIIAMILPGISGSFLLVLMGKYEQVLNAVVERDVLTLAVFATGIVIGISIFSRVLTWAFERHHDIIVAALTGFMIGSLRKIWPWKETISTYLDSHGVEQPLVEANIIPSVIDNNVIFAILLAAAAAFIMIRLDKMQATVEHLEDVEDKEFKKEHQKAVKSQDHD